MKKIAILGATGYIGKSLVSEFLSSDNLFEIRLFSRSKNKLDEFIKGNKVDSSRLYIDSLSDFSELTYDVVINCTGIGDTALQKESLSKIFTVTEEMDTLIINYLEKNPKTLYINLSSGAVFGKNFDKAITEETKSILNINNLQLSEYYSIAKINAEAKHRAMKNFNIVDLRIFAFFSRFVDIKAEFFMSEVIDCLIKKKPLLTNNTDMVRDYITPKDLFTLINLVIKQGQMNDFFDVYSKKNITKFKLLDFLKEKHGLKYEFREQAGYKKDFSKNIYYSKNNKAEQIGYVPALTSLEGIDYEINKMRELKILL